MPLVVPISLHIFTVYEPHVVILIKVLNTTNKVTLNMQLFL